ncbi:hypothetical protein C2845_PM11G15940 [Panicum miliaceum]|uniref:DUF7722 domain-containing protein n=1 Tax=Panicum miliaceum TaxID=4540 RepID=A0A3L6RPI3_PANMI|nr:hypothetical protein C2845_PM11G15940 [Panicum miliaceum]
MPLHYPRYKKVDYEAMPEWRVDCLLREYGLLADGDLRQQAALRHGRLPLARPVLNRGSSPSSVVISPYSED